MITECTHHFILESAESAAQAGHLGTSFGECQKCGEVREFQNSFDISPYNSASSIAIKEKREWERHRRQRGDS